MIKLIYFALILTLFVSCSRDNDGTESQPNYVGKWYFYKGETKIVEQSNSFTSYTPNDCEKLTNYEIFKDGNVKVNGYKKNSTTNNCDNTTGKAIYNPNEKAFYYYKSDGTLDTSKKYNVIIENNTLILNTTFTEQSPIQNLIYTYTVNLYFEKK